MSNFSTKHSQALVIGAGVNGLTSALCLEKEGFKVTVVAEDFAPNITSVVAGALWEYPPAVCGHHRNEKSIARSKEWCITSYNIFAELASNSETGVRMRPVVFFFKRPIEDNDREYNKMLEFSTKVQGFERNSHLIQDNDINANEELKDAYTFLAPIVDTDMYMDWLLKQAENSGINIIQRKISGSLLEQEKDLKAEFGADVIVNCSGLGSIELALDDTMYPLRGALVRVLNNSTTMAPVLKSYCMSFDDSTSNQDMIYIIPRGDDMLLLGGIVESDEWSTDIGLNNHQPVRNILERCIDFLPILEDANIDNAEPVRVGLRPSRKENIRLEAEPNSSIIHNYGHGGSGVTLSWGCAIEVASLAKTKYYS
ncbi:putative D-amino-acid oxidase [Calothrix sp. NIES-4071]|nr:putative D-amino-acid oxidase [Calothrix sp. NIES-4071]BAZ57074.1 putative D-amino-acid oxidase [Calothrix sp. NIES-4105]